MYTEKELVDLATKEMVIYKITNLVNNKVYIGQTQNTFNRRYGGRGVGVERVLNYYEAQGNSRNEHLYNSINKYGVDKFKVEILCSCSSLDELNEREEYYIDLHHANNYSKGYNVLKGGDNRSWGFNQKLRKILAVQTLDDVSYNIDEDGEFVVTKKYVDKVAEEDVEFFYKLIECGKLDEDKIINLLTNSQVVLIKKGGNKKHLSYQSLRDCCVENDIKVKDAFCMAMRRRIKDGRERKVLPRIPISKIEVNFKEDLKQK